MTGLPDDDLTRLPGVLDVTRLIDTYPRWRRPFAWLVWHLPVVRWVARRVLKVNPYRRVVAVIDAPAVMRTSKRMMNNAK